MARGKLVAAGGQAGRRDCGGPRTRSGSQDKWVKGELPNIKTPCGHDNRAGHPQLRGPG